MARMHHSQGKCLVLCLCIFLSGCSSTPDRDLGDALDDAREAILIAENNRAREFAPIEFRIAQDHFLAAEALAKSGDSGRMVQATLWAKQALTDARLAEMRARTEKLLLFEQQKQNTFTHHQTPESVDNP